LDVLSQRVRPEVAGPMTGSAIPITFNYARAVTNYRRNFICGGSFFITANLAERSRFGER